MISDPRKRLRILLIEKDVVLAEIARAIGVSKGHVYNVLAGRFPSQPVIRAVAKAVGVSPRDFEKNFIPRRAA